MGININDKCQDFTGQILRGEKTIETRNTRSLDPYIGERIGIVRTGAGKATLVGYVTVGEPVVYDSVAKFRRDYDKHLVAPGSAFDIKDGLKYGYQMMQVEAVEPRVIESKGIVARRVNPATPEGFPDVSSAKMRATPQTNTDAFKRWFDGSIVINPDGTPMVMYHGTGWTDLREFKSNRARGQISGFFAFDPEFAEDFAMIYGPDEFNADEEDELGVKKAASVYPAYLSLKKVFDVRKKEDRDAVGFKEVARGKGWDWTQLEEPSLIKKMRTLGFDGYIDFEAGSNYPPTGIAVFDPRSVKSAIGNRGTFDPADPDIRNPYTRPDLRERLKRKVIAGSKGGNPGQWSARKAQLLAAEYEKAGGGYTGKRSASQKSLSKWSKQDWRTKSGKPSLKTGERYLPAKAIKGLTAAEYAATTRAKRKATGQFSRQPKRIAMKTKEFRNPMDPRSAMTQIATTVNTYLKASKMLGGKVLDYGAGYGLGTDAMREEGLMADSFEPFPEEWKGKRPPTYTDSADIPPESYDSMVSFSVINVVDPDERKLLFREVSRILRPDGFALITGRTRQDVSAAKTKRPHLEDGGYLIGEGEDERYQKGFTQAELERYAKEVLGPGFTVETNRALNGASIKITKGKTNPVKRNAIRNKLSRIIESDDRILCYDTAADEDFYRLWDIIHTDLTLNKESLREIEGMLDDDGVLVIESGESPAGLQDHFRKTTRYQGLLLVQGPMNPEQARIETEKLRRDLE